jgi:hypothetical protein
VSYEWRQFGSEGERQFVGVVEVINFSGYWIIVVDLARVVESETG